MDRFAVVRELVAVARVLAGGRPLTRRNIKWGLVIRNRVHPGWGTWGVREEYAPGIWEIVGDRGPRVLNEGEFREWEIYPEDNRVYAREIGAVLTSRDFSAVADIMRKDGVAKNKKFVDDMVAWLGSHNPGFDEDRFCEALGV